MEKDIYSLFYIICISNNVNIILLYSVKKKKTRPDTRLSQSHAGGAGRGHIWAGAVIPKTTKKQKSSEMDEPMDGSTDRLMDGSTDRQSGMYSAMLKKRYVFSILIPMFKIELSNIAFFYEESKELEKMK